MSLESIDLRQQLARRFFRLALPMNLVLLGLVGTLFVVLLGPAARAGGLPLSTGLIAVLLTFLVVAFAATLAGAEYLRCRRQAGALIVLLNGPAGDHLMSRRGESGTAGWQRDVWLGTIGLFLTSALGEIGELRLRQMIARDRHVSELLDQHLGRRIAQGEAS